MTSSAYRQSSQVSRQADRLDPDNDLVSRMPLRRMDAEEVRDTLIYVAGRLDLRQFGRADPVRVRGDGLVTSTAVDGAWRRSIYLKQRRSQIDTGLEAFDLPQMNPNCRERVQSTVAQQALYLMNNSMVRELADSFAKSVSKDTLDPLAQIDGVYWTALSRAPSTSCCETTVRDRGKPAAARLTEVLFPAPSVTLREAAVHVPASANCGSVEVPWNVPFRVVPAMRPGDPETCRD
jgi:hypothetical protein